MTQLVSGIMGGQTIDFRLGQNRERWRKASREFHIGLEEALAEHEKRERLARQSAGRHRLGL